MRVQVLDHGYLEYIEHWGSDERIIEAARMSTAKGFLGWGTPEKPGDEKLLRYLYTEKPQHSTPFEMGGMIVEVQAPIMVYREWHRHRTQSYNEMSGRYTALPDINYIPSVERCLINSKTNKQAGTIKGADELNEETAALLMEEERTFLEAAEAFYQKKLKAGIPKELARTHIGVSRYSRMRASANLLNWLRFLTLRMHSKAQWEIQRYAHAVHDLLVEKFPRTMSLFDEGRPT